MIAGKINLITSPDIIFNNINSVFLIQPTIDIKKDLEYYLSYDDNPANIYIYEQSTKDLKWLLTVAGLADLVVIDIDNASDDVLRLTSYILSLPNTWYRTSRDNEVWDLINKNKFFKLSEILRVKE